MHANWAGNDSPFQSTDLYDELLREAREVAEKSLGRLRALQDHFPGAIPRADVENLELLRPNTLEDPQRASQAFSTEMEVVVEYTSLRVFGRVDTLSSPSRIVFHSPAPFSSGTRLSLSIASPREESPLRAVVRHCESHADGGWTIEVEKLNE